MWQIHKVPQILAKFFANYMINRYVGYNKTILYSMGTRMSSPHLEQQIPTHISSILAFLSFILLFLSV